MYRTGLALSALLLMPLPSTLAHAAEPVGRYLHGMVGQLKADEIWQLDDPDTGESLTADLDNLIYGGVAVQMNFSESAFEYGYESGGMLSFSNDTNVFFASGNSGAVVAAEVDNNFYLLDLYMGGFIGCKLGDHLRLYAAAGPALLLGSLELEDSEPVPTPLPQTVVISSQGRSTQGTAGIYGRLGFDLMFDNGITVGASVRQVNAQLDFDDYGEMDLNHPQYFINIGRVY